MSKATYVLERTGKQQPAGERLSTCITCHLDSALLMSEILWPVMPESLAVGGLLAAVPPVLITAALARAASFMAEHHAAEGDQLVMYLQDAKLVGAVASLPLRPAACAAARSALAGAVCAPPSR